MEKNINYPDYDPEALANSFERIKRNLLNIQRFAQTEYDEIALKRLDILLNEFYRINVLNKEKYKTNGTH